MTAYFCTFGCQMNVHDSERMAAHLESVGFSIVDNIQIADIIIVVTCSVRDKPEQKLASFLNNNVKKLKRKNPDIIVAVAGCVAQQKGNNIINDFPFVDMVIGPDGIDKMLDLYHAIKETKKSHAVYTDFDTSMTYKNTLLKQKTYLSSHVNVTVMKGCNNFCSYCIVPYVRGRECSRTIQQVTDDIKALVQKGITSITLLGQNISRFGKDNNQTLFDLLYATGLIKGLKRLSIMTAHPKDFDTNIIKCYEDIEIMSPQLHLPAQHGSNKILKAMNRGYTKEDYLEKINILKQSKIWNKIAISTDIIVGFPGENEDDFNGLMSLLEEVRFDNSYSFMYSPRPGTKAYKEYGAVIDSAFKSTFTKRLMMYQARQKEISYEKNKLLLDNIYEILVDGKSSKDNNTYKGRTSSGKIVAFKSKDGIEIMTGQYIMAKIIKTHPTHLTGELI